MARRDLTPEEWRKVSEHHTRLPRDTRSALARLLSVRTGLSVPTVYRRLAGKFPGKMGRPAVTSAEQRQQIVDALERTNGRISPLDLYADVLGAPVSPSLQTVRRVVRRWRKEQLAQMQLDLPLGPERATVFAAIRTPERVAQDAMAVLMRVMGGSR